MRLNLRATTLVCVTPLWLLLGECLAQSANSAKVYNTPLIQRFLPDNALDINGFTAGSVYGELFSGFRGFSLTPRRVAMTGQSYEGDDYQTLFADASYCTNVCAPKLSRNVIVGELSVDSGRTYQQVFADVAAITYVDSAQDYSNNGATEWDTRNYPDLFSEDSTIGIRVHETHIGVHGEGALSDFRLTIVDVTNRSAVDSIDDLAHFAFHDNDPASGDPRRDHVYGSIAAGLAYTALDNMKAAHGYIRAPFGCGIDGDIIRARGLLQDESSWSFEAVQFYDSLYLTLRAPQYAGITAQYSDFCFPEDCSNSDRATLYGFGLFDLAPGETHTFAIAEFVRTNIEPGNDTDQFVSLADVVNKFCGFGRGDVNSDLRIDLADIVFLAGALAGGAGPYPFVHLGDVNADGALNVADLSYLIDYYCNCGPCPVGKWELGRCE